MGQKELIIPKHLWPVGTVKGVEMKLLIATLMTLSIFASQDAKIPADAKVCILTFNPTVWVEPSVEKLSPSFSCDGKASKILRIETRVESTDIELKFSDSKQERTAQYMKFLKKGYKINSILFNGVQTIFTK